MRIDSDTPPPARLATKTIIVLSVTALTAGILLAGPATAAAAATVSGAPAESTAVEVTAVDPSTAGRLDTLGDLVAQRLRLATPVAQYKWLHGTPIADPAREQAVIDAVTAAAERKGIDPTRVSTVVRSQIAASKLVQRGLFTQWTHDPWTAPTTAPDIATIRQQITDIDDELVDAVGATVDVAAEPRCAHVVEHERRRTDQALDSLERKGLHLAWVGFCHA